MAEERGTGVFGSVGNSDQNGSSGSKIVDLEVFDPDDGKPDTIYELLFAEYDEEKKN